MDNECRKPVHPYSTWTTVNRGHAHLLLGVSGLLQPGPEDTHVHTLSGRTTFDRGHFHTYTVETAGAVRVLPPHLHVHRCQGETDVAEEHTHSFRYRMGPAPEPREDDAAEASKPAGKAEEKPEGMKR